MGRSRNGRVRNGRSRIGRSRNGTSTGWLRGIYLATREYGWLQGIYLATREYNCRGPVWLPGDIFVIRKYDYGNVSSYQGSMAVVEPGCQVIWQQEIYFTTGESDYCRFGLYIPLVTMQSAYHGIWI
jgi:hypothetical protein